MGPAFIGPAILVGLAASALAVFLAGSSPFLVILVSVAAFALSFLVARFSFVRAGYAKPGRTKDRLPHDRVPPSGGA